MATPCANDATPEFAEEVARNLGFESSDHLQEHAIQFAAERDLKVLEREFGKEYVAKVRSKPVLLPRLKLTEKSSLGGQQVDQNQGQPKVQVIRTSAKSSLVGGGILPDGTFDPNIATVSIDEIGIDEVSRAQIQYVIDLIKQDADKEQFDYPNEDGKVHHNREGFLPGEPNQGEGRYYEYTVLDLEYIDHGFHDRGARRIVYDDHKGHFYYTEQHYKRGVKGGYVRILA
jgi:guanyl-specific ribonuclease Sa